MVHVFGVKKRNGHLKIKYFNTELPLFPRGIPDKILLSISGGLDSASLFFLICKHFPEMEIIPYTGKDKHAPFDYECATDVVSWMRQKFPNNNILEHEWFEFDKTEPEWIKKAEDYWEEAKVPVDGKMIERCSTIGGLIKIIRMEMFVRELSAKYDNPMIVTGMTGNPPMDEMKKHGFYDVREKRRDHTHTDDRQQEYGQSYLPFVNVDKRFVASIYLENDIMDLYDLTNSCIGNAEHTNFFTKPCGTCFWCHEKKWAFNAEHHSNE